MKKFIPWVLLACSLVLCLVLFLALRKQTPDDTTTTTTSSSTTSSTTSSCAHADVNGDHYCDYGCGAVASYSQGLKYTLSEDGTYYILSGIGTCTDTEVFIPPTYNGLPVTSIGDYALNNCNSLTSVEIPDSVTSIGFAAFYSCSSLTSVVIGNSVTSIGDLAFCSCSGLTSVKIPDSVTSIGNSAFSSCDSLTNIEVRTSNAAYKSIDGNLYTKDGKTLILYAIGKTATHFEISSSVTSIGDYAFLNCSSMTSVIIGSGVKYISEMAFAYCTSLTTIKVSADNSAYKAIDNVLYSKDGKTLLLYPAAKEEASFIIPDGVENVADYAFSDCRNLTSIEIPDSVTSIGDSAFDGCTSLTFNEYGNCRYLGNASNPYVALIGVTSQNLSSYDIHNDTRVIAGRAFYWCTSLTSVEIPNSVTSIGDYAFAWCSGLTSIEIPDSVTSIGDYAFAWCSGLTSVEIPDSVTSIGHGAFYDCTSLSDAYYTGTAEQWRQISIGSDNSNLTDATIHYNYIP